ncbi:MAG: hypothetical protein ACFFAZ_08935 [Promethearchaeota archaeon]
MTADWVEWVNSQLGAAIEMLANAMKYASDEVWDNPSDERRFWNIAYHTIYFLDVYLSDFDPEITNVEGQYEVPAYLEKWGEAFDFDEVHEPAISKEVLQRFFEETRSKLRSRFAEGIIENQVEEKATSWLEMSKGSVLLYNMRHIMQHVGHLNDILREHGLPTSGWLGLAPI